MFKVPISLRQSRKRLEGVDYQVLPVLSYNPGINAAFFWLAAALIRGRRFHASWSSAQIENQEPRYPVAWQGRVVNFNLKTSESHWGSHFSSRCLCRDRSWGREKWSALEKLTDTGAIHSNKIQAGPTGKSCPLQKVDQFLRNFSEISGNFWLNGSRQVIPQRAELARDLVWHKPYLGMITK